MRLTRASSYAIHALVFMSSQKENQPVPSHAIARARGIPERFLLKVLKPLVSVRVLHSIKGPNGGYSLARSAGEISLLDIIEAVDGPLRGQQSFARGEMQGALDRKLDRICDEAADLVRRHFQKIRVTDLASKAS